MPYSINGDYCFCEIHDKETIFKNSGYERPLEKNYNELTKLFNDILFFIYCSEKKKNFMQLLAKALSKDADADLLDNLIHNKMGLQRLSIDSYSFKGINLP